MYGRRLKRGRQIVSPYTEGKPQKRVKVVGTRPPPPYTPPPIDAEPTQMRYDPYTVPSDSDIGALVAWLDGSPSSEVVDCGVCYASPQ